MKTAREYFKMTCSGDVITEKNILDAIQLAIDDHNWFVLEQQKHLDKIITDTAAMRKKMVEIMALLSQGIPSE